LRPKARARHSGQPAGAAACFFQNSSRQGDRGGLHEPRYAEGKESRESRLCLRTEAKLALGPSFRPKAAHAAAIRNAGGGPSDGPRHDPRPNDRASSYYGKKCAGADPTALPPAMPAASCRIANATDARLPWGLPLPEIDPSAVGPSAATLGFLMVKHDSTCSTREGKDRGRRK